MIHQGRHLSSKLSRFVLDTVVVATNCFLNELDSTLDGRGIGVHRVGEKAPAIVVFKRRVWVAERDHVRGESVTPDDRDRVGRLNGDLYADGWLAHICARRTACHDVISSRAIVDLVLG